MQTKANIQEALDRLLTEVPLSPVDLDQAPITTAVVLG
jgi:hypothetical protein